MDYYSAWLVFICLVDDGRPRRTNTYDDCTFVFRARNYKQALTRALKLGQAHEHEYLNIKGQKVRWSLVEIAKLRRIGPAVENEEVSSQLDGRRSKAPIPFGKRFYPERSKPTVW